VPHALKHAAFAGALLLGAATLHAAQPAVALPVPNASSSRPAEPPEVEVPYEGTLTVKIPGVTRVLSVNPGIIEATVRAPGIVELRGKAFGRTFIHAWSPSGRSTRAAQVVEPIRKQLALIPPVEAAARRARHLTFEYENRFNSLRRGPSLDATDRNTTTIFDHDLRSQMETPYGGLRGRLSFQRLDGAHDLSSWGAALLDGDIGPVEHFDLLAGDTTIGISDFTVPESRIRGGALRFRQFDPYLGEIFAGRQRFGFGSGLSPASSVEDDVRLAGILVRDTAKPWTWDAAYVTASGADRTESQASQAAEAESWIWPHPTLGFGVHGGVNQDAAHAAQVKSAIRSKDLTVDVTYRNISQRYDNVLGREADQGEVGVQAASQMTMGRGARLRQSLDVYQDTLFVNPEEPKALNAEMEWGADIDLTERLQWHTTYDRQRLLGRLFPSDATGVTTGLRRRIGQVPLLSGGTVFGDYLFRDLRSVSAPESDFSSHTAIVGLGAPLSDLFYWQLSQQWTALDETLSGAKSFPRQTSGGINYYQRLQRVPLSLHGGFNFSTASNAGSTNSFLADEDRLEWNAGLRYDLSLDAYAFLDSRLLRRARLTGRDYEIDFETGVRYFFDTGLAWEPAVRLSGVVFEDTNGDGIRQSEEEGLGRVKVAAGGRQAETDPGGRFYLGRVRGGRLKVTVDLASTPPGYVPTTPSTIEFDLDKPRTVSLSFGFVPRSELRARVFLDANGNGQYDATDAPMDRVRLLLAASPAAGGTSSPAGMMPARSSTGATMATDRSGWAFFRGLEPGVYTVTLSVPDLAIGYVPIGPPTRTVEVPKGRTGLAEFAVKAERSVGGRVYADRNRNGSYDADETALGGIPVCLDGAKRRVTTQEDGSYWFTDVTAGLHTVQLNCGAPLSGYLPLSATVLSLDMPPQPIRMEQADFRLGPVEAVMQGVVSDVLKARETRDGKSQAMDRALEDAVKRRQDATN